MNNLSDEILSQEAQLMFERAPGAFNIMGGDLSKWIGAIPLRTNPPSVAEIQISLPNNFPKSPPKVVAITKIKHSIVDNNGEIKTRRLSRWRTDYHAFQIVAEIRNAFEKEVPEVLQKVSAASSQSSLITSLKSQKEQLKQIIRNKKTELTRIETTSSSSISSADLETERAIMIKESLFDLEMELHELESRFDEVEISGIEFAHRFLNIRKRYYMLKMHEEN
ncbi:MAG: hypothetical protein KAR35_00850 [Candidatus Heimdallarchaeota archaeon]|nr:hypothetical protein [Candidatus Heimdallarchaeota archaeon]MCK5047901.1 hypothetical protein [Candidatus Heimdallarchaeota archaeon]